MAQKIPVEKIKNGGPNRLWERLNALGEDIRQRAFSRFERRGQTGGGEVDDWLEAERELVWSPPSELIEDKEDFQARVALAGFDAKDVEVTAAPEALVIEADKTHTHNTKAGNVHFCEFSAQKLLRRINLPTAIDVDR